MSINARGRWGALAVGAALCAGLTGLLGPAQSGTAVGNPTLRIEPVSRTVNPGDSFVVRVTQTAAVPTTGSKVDLEFDETLLKVTDVEHGGSYFGGGFDVGIGAQTEAQAISAANTTGTLENVEVFVTPPVTIAAGPPPDYSPREVAVITMEALVAVSGVSPLTLSDVSMKDSVGGPLTVNTIANGTATVDDPDFRIDRPLQSVTAGQTFRLGLRHDMVTAAQGAQVTLGFNQTKLEILSVGAGYSYPSVLPTAGIAPQTVAQAIAEANTTGLLLNAAAFFGPPTLAEPLGTLRDPQEFLVVTMRALPATSGVSPLTLSFGEILDPVGNSVDPQYRAGAIGIGPDADGDGVAENLDNCPAVANPGQGDVDADGLGTACEALIGTSDSVADFDGDGCKDGQEIRLADFAGGGRDPLDYWDVFDVSADAAVDLTDTIDVLAFFGDDGTSPAANLRDRGSPIGSELFRTSESDDGVDLTDAINSLAQFGASC